MFPKMEMDEHRADRQKIEARIAELEKQLADSQGRNPALIRFGGNIHHPLHEIG